MSCKRTNSLTTNIPGAYRRGDSCQGIGWGQAKDGWPLQSRLPSSAETRASGNGLAAPSCKQLHFLPQLNDRLHLLTLTYSITFSALKDLQRNKHK